MWGPANPEPVNFPWRTLLSAALFALVMRGTLAGAPAVPVVPTDRGQIAIGLLAPSTGPFANIGADVDDGFKYYLATHGDRLSGFRVGLHEGDEGASLDAALASAKDLIENQKSDVVVGLVNSDIAYGVADYLVQQKVPTIVAVAGADGLTQARANPLVFRVTNTNSQTTMPLGDYVCSVMHKKTAAIVALDFSFGYETAGGFARVYTDEGCRVLQELYVPLATTDFASYVAKIDRNASVVYASISGIDTPRFLQAYRDAGIKAPLVGHGSLTDELILGSEGANALGVVTSLHYSATLPSARNTAFRLGYEGLTHRPVSRYVEDGYVAAQALEAALAKLPSGAVKSDALVAALRGVQFQAPRGFFRFDDRHAAILDMHIRRVREVGGRPRNAIVTTYPAVTQFWHYDPARYLGFKSYGELKGTWARPFGSPAPATASPAPTPRAPTSPAPSTRLAPTAAASPSP